MNVPSSWSLGVRIFLIPFISFLLRGPFVFFLQTSLLPHFHLALHPQLVGFSASSMTTVRHMPPSPGWFTYIPRGNPRHPSAVLRVRIGPMASSRPPNQA
ncbi:hypothetical protein B0H16DRAFT_1605922 [Mycena metata]|uniref:Uncharacterized protein n=1 Tax=Mycena metata TaxID=1033252 RepID=A0AAD7HFL3_9AGAR|nr:hypothetical protein B0H16DRAFT_1605922 [Mycena metata]